MMRFIRRTTFVALTAFCSVIAATAAMGNTAASTGEANSRLFDAISVDSDTKAKASLESGADVNAREPRTGATALMIASGRGYLSIVRLLLASGADVKARANDGSTALIEAAKGDQSPAQRQYYLQTVQALLSGGADVNARANSGDTALLEASHNGDIAVVQALLAANADVNAKETIAAVTTIKIKDGQLQKPVTKPKRTGVTALMLAAEGAYLPIVEALVAAHADVNAKAGNGDTALKLALKNGNREIVDTLRKAGAKR